MLRGMRGWHLALVRPALRVKGFCACHAHSAWQAQVRHAVRLTSACGVFSSWCLGCVPVVQFAAGVLAMPVPLVTVPFSAGGICCSKCFGVGVFSWRFLGAGLFVRLWWFWCWFFFRGNFLLLFFFALVLRRCFDVVFWCCFCVLVVVFRLMFWGLCSGGGVLSGVYSCCVFVVVFLWWCFRALILLFNVFHFLSCVCFHLIVLFCFLLYFLFKCSSSPTDTVGRC